MKGPPSGIVLVQGGDLRHGQEAEGLQKLAGSLLHKRSLEGGGGGSGLLKSPAPQPGLSQRSLRLSPSARRQSPAHADGQNVPSHIKPKPVSVSALGCLKDATVPEPPPLAPSRSSLTDQTVSKGQLLGTSRGWAWAEAGTKSCVPRWSRPGHSLGIGVSRSWMGESVSQRNSGQEGQVVPGLNGRPQPAEGRELRIFK